MKTSVLYSSCPFHRLFWSVYVISIKNCTDAHCFRFNCVLHSSVICFCFCWRVHCLCDKNEWPLINFWTECWWWRRHCLVDTEYCFNFWCWFHAQKNAEKNANEFNERDTGGGRLKESVSRIRSNQIKSMQFKMNCSIVLMSFLTQIHRHEHHHKIF